jgi:hypothetical protein
VHFETDGCHVFHFGFRNVSHNGHKGHKGKLKSNFFINLGVDKPFDPVL